MLFARNSHTVLQGLRIRRKRLRTKAERTQRSVLHLLKGGTFVTVLFGAEKQRFGLGVAQGLQLCQQEPGLFNPWCYKRSPNITKSDDLSGAPPGSVSCPPPKSRSAANTNSRGKTEKENQPTTKVQHYYFNVP